MNIGKPLFKFGRCINDRAICEDGRSSAPLCSLPIEHSQVPKNALTLTTSRLGSKLLMQFFCHEMILVPILNNP